MNILLTKILSSPWLISHDRAPAYASLLMSLLKGETITGYEHDEERDNDDEEKEDKSALRGKNRSYVTSKSVINSRYALSDSKIPEGSIAVIPIRSEIMKYDEYCGPRGSMSILQDLQAADANPKIKSILLIVDSPGGQVSFTDILADAIKNSKTPIIAYVEGMAASAAYWIVSGAKKIIASSDLDRIGCIGTMLFFADLQSYYESLGVVFHKFYATLSTDKNKDIEKVLLGDKDHPEYYEDYKKSVLDPINNKFLASVQANRPKLDKTTLTGKTYFAPEAITLGLIDEIGTMEYALEIADQMEMDISVTTDIPDDDNEDKLNPESKIHNSNKIDMKLNGAWKAVLAFFKVGAEKAEDTSVTPEMMQQLNDQLASLEGCITMEKDLREKAEKSLNDEKAAHKITQDKLTAELTKDAGSESIAAKEKDKTTSGEEINLAHNSVADSFVGPPKEESGK